MNPEQLFQEWWSKHTATLPKDRWGCYVTPSELTIFLAGYQARVNERDRYREALERIEILTRLPERMQERQDHKIARIALRGGEE